MRMPLPSGRSSSSNRLLLHLLPAIMRTHSTALQHQHAMSRSQHQCKQRSPVQVSMALLCLLLQHESVFAGGLCLVQVPVLAQAERSASMQWCLSPAACSHCMHSTKSTLALLTDYAPCVSQCQSKQSSAVQYSFAPFLLPAAACTQSVLTVFIVHRIGFGTYVYTMSQCQRSSA